MPGKRSERRHLSGEGSEKGRHARQEVREEILIRRGVREGAGMPGKRTERRHISGEGSERGQACQA